MRPTRDELGAVVGVLTSSEYATDEDAAKAIFDLVLSLLSERQSYAVGIAVGETMSVWYGTFYDRVAVNKFARQVKATVGDDTEVGVLPVSPTGKFLMPHPERCSACGHSYHHLRCGIGYKAVTKGRRLVVENDGCTCEEVAA